MNLGEGPEANIETIFFFEDFVNFSFFFLLYVQIISNVKTSNCMVMGLKLSTTLFYCV